MTTAVATPSGRFSTLPAPSGAVRRTTAGTATLTRFYLRRDRVRIPVWAGSVALMFLYATSALSTVYPTAADRQARAQLISSPAAVMMSGPGYGADDYTLGAMIANEMALTVMIAVAIMSLLLIVRHTRAEEETGRAELVRAGVVGRHAPAAAAFLTAVVANLAIVVLSTLALMGAGLDLTDSFALSVAVGLTGLVFAAVAVVTSQLTEHSRAASGAALAVLGAAFLFRAIGDVQQTHGSWLSWLSPIGWAQQIRAFVDLRWWPLLLSVAAVIVLLVVAGALSGRRDLGAGLVPPRAGVADAAPSLRGPLALAWRQQRASILAWVCAIVIMGYAMGTLTSSVEDMLTDNPTLEDMLGGAGDLTEAFVAVLVLFFALAIGAFALSSFLRVRGEEASGRLEPLLATGVSRSRWLLGNLAVTAIGTVVLLGLAGLSLGLGAASAGVGSLVGPLLGAGLVYVPAMGVVVGVACALYGLRSGLASLAWVLLGYAFVVGIFGTLLDLPAAAADISPFQQTPALPGADVAAAPLVIMAVLTVALVAVGIAGFRRRDVSTS